MAKEFEGVGLTPFDPYHNSTYVVAGKQPTYCFSEKALFAGAYLCPSH